MWVLQTIVNNWSEKKKVRKPSEIDHSRAELSRGGAHFSRPPTPLFSLPFPWKKKKKREQKRGVFGAQNLMIAHEAT